MAPDEVSLAASATNLRTLVPLARIALSARGR